MKKSFLFSFGLVAAFALLFVSCDNGDDECVSCTVSATATEGGSVAIENYSGNTAVLLAGNTVKFIATPNEGYQFVGWYIDGSKTPVSTELTYLFIANKDVAYIAKFEKTFSVSVCSGGNGNVSFGNSSERSQYIKPGEKVTVVATPANNDYVKYEFIGWFVDNSETAVSTEAIYTFTVEKNISLIAKFKTILEAVDLGLPSGIKWANYNVGATSLEESGCRYAWGETEEKEDYSWETYKWCNGSGDTMTKYCTESSYGAVDNKTVLDPEDDVAHVKWGGDWRMPTYDEQRELYFYCDWQSTSYKHITGFRVTGPNGNSIFLSVGPYWSSSNYCGRAFGLVFIVNLYMDYYPRYDGYYVRPVCE